MPPGCCSAPEASCASCRTVLQQRLALAWNRAVFGDSVSRPVHCSSALPFCPCASALQFSNARCTSRLSGMSLAASRRSARASAKSVVWPFARPRRKRSFARSCSTLSAGSLAASVKPQVRSTAGVVRIAALKEDNAQVAEDGHYASMAFRFSSSVCNIVLAWLKSRQWSAASACSIALELLVAQLAELLSQAQPGVELLWPRVALLREPVEDLL
eukprot:CAMPEP_0175567072 /NCGR_PEP_ID=MMETSP0096-20121207/40275_1 /TAXON_ID=311494 /ORGANISM="Alexandrium monilatum, Strain CCMP3105" /LENGTH=214 /DNA_ID=CAMNT_0016870387 /DNA_START=139 /DNA_END=779 /DNA_ORIENTATION=-